jgi:hypothetical protein
MHFGLNAAPHKIVFVVVENLEYNLHGRQPHWKLILVGEIYKTNFLAIVYSSRVEIISKFDNKEKGYLHGQIHPWKTTCMEDELTGSWNYEKYTS